MPHASPPREQSQAGTFVQRGLGLLVGLAGLLVALPAWGATYYVSTTGSDLAAGTEGAPWATIGTCATTMVAGDTCVVRAGTYSEGTIAPAASGTAGSVITYKNYPGERPKLQGARFDITNKSYLTIEGFECTKTLACFETSNDEANPSTHITFRRNYVHTVLNAANDNTPGFYVNACDTCVVEYNRAHTICNNCTDTNNPATCLCRDKNAAAVFGFNSYNMTVRYNHLSDAGEGVFVKSAPGANGTGAKPGPHWTIHHNYIHDVDEGIWLSVSGNQDNPHDGIVIHDNLFTACRVGVLEDVSTATYAGGVEPSDLSVYNNTFGTMTDESILAGGWQGAFEIYNNIFTGPTDQAYQISAADMTVLDYNVFATGADTFDIGGTLHSSLAAWQAAGPWEDHGQVAADLGFIPGTFRLGPASPAYNACKTGGTTAGATVHCGAPADHSDAVGMPPPAPTGVTVQ